MRKVWLLKQPFYSSFKYFKTWEWPHWTQPKTSSSLVSHLWEHLEKQLPPEAFKVGKASIMPVSASDPVFFQPPTILISMNFGAICYSIQPSKRKPHVVFHHTDVLSYWLNLQSWKMEYFHSLKPNNQPKERKSHLLVFCTFTTAIFM